MTVDDNPLAVVAEVAAVFDRLHIAYVVGGSVASSLYGIPRATQDADFVLQKLAWFKQGGGTSERQWGDVLGILRMQPKLDDAYLDTWADLLDVTALLTRARRER